MAEERAGSESGPPSLVGRFVVICEGAIFGPYRTYAAAVRRGRELCGGDRFEIMRLGPAEPPSRQRERDDEGER